MISVSISTTGIYPRGFSEERPPIWPMVRADSVVELRYGKALTESARRSGVVPVYGTNGRTGWHDEALSPGPGVVLGRKGMGNLGVEWCPSPFWVIDTAYFAQALTKELDLHYFYYLISYIGLNHLKDGTSNPSLSRDTFGAQLLPLPPRDAQREIAETLSEIDAKIEQNGRTGRKLEALARAVFKAWFVDFEPVKAKAAGATAFPGMPAETFATLPKSLVDSELGPVPNGWDIVDVYQLARVIYGAPFKSKLFNETGHGKPLIRIRDLQTHSPSVFTPEMHPKGTLVKPGDVVVGMDGEFRLHYWTGQDAWLNQRLCAFEPLPGVPKMFLGESLRPPLDFIERSEAATTVIHLGKYDIDRFRILRPDDNTLAAFGQVTSPILALLCRLAEESRKLATLRDYLLPRLLSGRVRVRETEGMIHANA